MPFLSIAPSMRFLQSPQLASTANEMVVFLTGLGAEYFVLVKFAAPAILAKLNRIAAMIEIVFVFMIFIFGLFNLILSCINDILKLPKHKARPDGVSKVSRPVDVAL